MYTKEHSSYLRILEKGEEFEECITSFCCWCHNWLCHWRRCRSDKTSHEQGSEHQIWSQRG